MKRLRKIIVFLGRDIQKKKLLNVVPVNKYHLNSQDLQQFSSSYIVFDTHVLSAMVEDEEFRNELQKMFFHGYFIINPYLFDARKREGRNKF